MHLFKEATQWYECQTFTHTCSHKLFVCWYLAVPHSRVIKYDDDCRLIDGWKLLSALLLMTGKKTPRSTGHSSFIKACPCAALAFLSIQKKQTNVSRLILTANHVNLIGISFGCGFAGCCFARFCELSDSPCVCALNTGCVSSCYFTLCHICQPTDYQRINSYGADSVFLYLHINFGQLFDFSGS